MLITVKVKETTKDFLIIISYALLIATSIFIPAEYGFHLSDGFLPLVVLIVCCMINKGFSLRVTAFRAFAFLYSLVLTYSTLTSNIVHYSSSFRSTIILIFSFILMCDATPTQKQFNVIKRIWIYLAIIACLFVFIDAISDGGGLFSVDRYSFTFINWTKDVNYFVASILPAGYFAMRNFMFREYGKSSIVDIVCVISIAIIILMLQTRASFLTFCAFALLLIIEYMFQTKLTVSKYVATCIGALVCMGIIVLVVTNPEFSRLTDSSGYGDDVRLKVWKAAMKAYHENPWLGSGLNASNTYSFAETELTTHNNFLDILGDSGIVGAIIFGLLLLSILLVKKQNLLNMLAMAVAFLLPMAFINGFQGITFWLPMIFMAHQSKLLKKDIDGKLYNGKAMITK